MPSAQAFAEAVQFPDTAFTDSLLAGCTPDLTTLGLPRGISGAFAIVFRMTDAMDDAWAAKCFFNPSPDLHRRFSALSARLGEYPVDAVAPFNFLPGGIRVEGQAWPVLRMPWQSGRSLISHVQHHLDEPDALIALTSALAATQRDLEAAGIAHGDLQHGNVIVDGDPLAPRIRLIDLDAVYVPSLRKLSSLEAGHRNYAHPDRGAGDFGPHVDRFTFRILDASLRALAARPALWDVYHTGENLIFSAADFFDPDTSSLLADLRADRRTSSLAETVRRASLLPPERVPVLGEVVEKPRHATRVPVEMPRRFVAFGYGFMLFALLAIYGVLIVAVVVGNAPLSWTVAGSVIAATLGISAMAMYSYQRHPHTRRTRRLAQEAASLNRLIANVDAERVQLEADRERLVTNIDDLRAERLRHVQNDALRDRLKHHLIGEAASAGVPHKAIVRMKLAGIRSAWHATHDHVRQAMELADETRAQVGLWRNGLIQTYHDAIPSALSEGEERRLARERTHRIDELDAQLGRTEERHATLDQERAALVARTSDHQPLGFAAYWKRLLTARPLPTVAAPAPAPNAPRSAQPAVTPDDGPWWQN